MTAIAVVDRVKPKSRYWPESGTARTADVNESCQARADPKATSGVVWTVLNALALTLSVVGAAKTARQLDLSTRALRFVTNTREIAIAGLGLFLLGTLPGSSMVAPDPTTYARPAPSTDSDWPS